MPALHTGFRQGLIGVATLFYALGPLAAHAQEGATVSPDAVRAQFVNAGYQVGQSTTCWTDGSTTFLVRPTSGSPDQMGRVLMVVVYPDVQTAQSERQRSQTNVATQSMDASRPLLLPGYAPTFWWENVALVESGMTDWTQRYQSSVESDMLPDDTAGQLQTQQQQSLPVDADFVAVLLQGSPTVNL